MDNDEKGERGKGEKWNSLLISGEVYPKLGVVAEVF